MQAKHALSLSKQKNQFFLLDCPSSYTKLLLNSFVIKWLIKEFYNLIQKELFPTLINASGNLWGPLGILKKLDVSEDASLHRSRMGVFVFCILECLSACQKSKRFTNYVFTYYSLKYALVITRFREQYDRYFPSLSYFTVLFHESLGKWNNSKIWKTRKILFILCKITKQ